MTPAVPQAAPTPTLEAIQKGLSLYFQPNSVHEIRIFESDRKTGAVSLLFDGADVEGAATAIFRRARQRGSLENFCVTMNPGLPDLLAKKGAVGDDHISRRRRLVFDFDYNRQVKGISATEEELIEINACAEAAREKLKKEFGWPDPYGIMSGNGYHLAYEIDLPNDAASKLLIERVLKAADALFRTKHVGIDKTIFSASHIIKVPGTMAKKGNDLPDRPHRLSQTVFLPPQPPFVSFEQLSALAALVPEAEPKISTSNGYHALPSFNVAAFLEKYGIDHRGPDTHNGSERYVLAHCPFNPDHKDPDAAVFQNASGKPGFKCLHDSCCDKHWRDFREYYEPSASRSPWNGTAPHGQNGIGRGACKPPESDDEEEDSSPIAQNMPYPEPIGEAGYYGVIGKIVDAFSPHTEADPNFLLVSLLVAAGNYLDRKAYIKVSGARHYTNLFVCAVGPTGTGRKGTAMDNTFTFLQKLEDSYTEGDTSCIEWAALSSGEGLVARIKDPVMKPGKEPGSSEIAEPGRLDKRIISIQDELGSALQNMKRSGNNLSSFLRTAWDGRNLGSLTKSPYRATKPHVSMITGITRKELLSGIEDGVDNGFANRFLWCCSKQSKMLPEGGQLQEEVLQPYADHWKKARMYAASVELVERDAEAKGEWGSNDSPNIGLYAKLNQPRVGTFAACVTRAHVMVLRMALIFSLLDYRQDEKGRPLPYQDKNGNTLPCEIRREHLLAAEEVWRYCEDSAFYIFGGAPRNELAEEILDYLRSVGPAGATRTEISLKACQNNKTAEEITAALAYLRNDCGDPLISCQSEKRLGARKTTQIFRAL